MGSTDCSSKRWAQIKSVQEYYREQQIPVGFRRRKCETFTLRQARPIVWRLSVSSAPEKPRWVLVGLQTGKSGNQEGNAAIFDHCNLTNMQMCLNHSRYPSADTATDFYQVVLRFC